MGLLGDIFRFGDRAKRKVKTIYKGLTGNPNDYLEQAGDIYADNWKQVATDPLNNLGPDMIGKIVYHGSPHKFDKFDMSKIGSGEGAQAYGHGLYMAEAPEVAQKYASDLGVIGAIDSSGRQLSKGDISMIFAERLEKSGVPSGAARSQGDLWAESFVKGQIPKHSIAQNAIKYLGLRQSIDSSIYKVDIPDEAVARFLDWDKPLSQQAPEVQNALSNTKNKQLRAMVEYANVPYSEMAGGEAKTMGEAFRLLNLNLQGKSSADSAKASALLAKQGIPGIRYLDGGSRSTGQGSSNFVLFDDKMARIIERNGEATGLKPWEPNEWDGLMYRDPLGDTTK